MKGLGFRVLEEFLQWFLESSFKGSVRVRLRVPGEFLYKASCNYKTLRVP